jgi:crotonobetainyl-CoA:carnitine CoA-transferase CaiB-like acyl-CoA transferase
VTARALPLRGIRVVNFGVGGVAPWAASQLAQLGATVVKIEAPNEFIMYTLPPWRGLTTTYAALNANSRSVKLNLKDEGDRRLAWQLVGSADVMIENFRSGAIDRMGFGFDVVAVRNPRIVFCSSSGFGREGDMAGLPCTDPHIQAFSGFATLNGDTKGGPAPNHSDARHSAPDGLYSTSDGTIAITVESDTEFRALCAVIQRDDLARDTRFVTGQTRLANMQALDAELQKAFAAAPSDWWLVALGRAGIACARAHSDHEASAHRDTWRRGHLREIAIRDAGTLRAAAPPWDFEGINPVPGRAPRPGEHSDLLRKDPANFWVAVEREE